MKNLFFIFSFAKNYKKYIFWYALFMLLFVVFSVFSLGMLVPVLNILFDANPIVLTKPSTFVFSYSSIVANFNYFISSTIAQNGKVTALLYICFGILAAIFLKNISQYMAMYSMAPVRNGIIKDLRLAIYNKILKLPLGYYSNERKGDIISRISNDVQDVEWSVLSVVVIVFKEPLTIIAFVASLFIISTKLTLFILVLLPLAGFIISRIAKSLKKQSATSREKIGNIMSMVEEGISGLRIIKTFNAQKYNFGKFEEENKSLTASQIKMFRRVDMSSPLSEFMGVMVLIVVMYYGGNMVLGGSAEIGASTFITYLAIFSQVINPAKNFTNGYYNMMRGVASADRINAILQAPLVVEDAPNAIDIKAFNSEINYKEVSFAYGEKTVINNLNLSIPKGKMIALVGQSGAGKSTIADLLPRFYDVTSGGIYIDGQNIKDLSLHSLNGLIGMVTQESILFNDTIAANIAFGSENIDLSRVEEAAKVANAHEFIVKMESGYNSNIGDRGSKLSGGQKQRIAIARAVYKNPPILILDEATSALDTESERLVQDALQNLMKHRTSIVIAHRLSTIQYADAIIVMHEGNIAEQGTHNELYNANGMYRKLCDMQTFG